MKSAKVNMKIPTANEAHDAAELSDAELKKLKEWHGERSSENCEIVIFEFKLEYSNLKFEYELEYSNLEFEYELEYSNSISNIKISRFSDGRSQ